MHAIRNDMLYVDHMKKCRNSKQMKINDNQEIFEVPGQNKNPRRRTLNSP
jgi:hypothetical protein